VDEADLTYQCTEYATYWSRSIFERRQALLAHFGIQKAPESIVLFRRASSPISSVGTVVYQNGYSPHIHT
jgi:hypothetical protein